MQRFSSPTVASIFALWISQTSCAGTDPGPLGSGGSAAPGGGPSGGMVSNGGSGGLAQAGGLGTSNAGRGGMPIGGASSNSGGVGAVAGTSAVEVNRAAGGITGSAGSGGASGGRSSATGGQPEAGRNSGGRSTGGGDGGRPGGSGGTPGGGSSSGGRNAGGTQASGGAGGMSTAGAMNTAGASQAGQGGSSSTGGGSSCTPAFSEPPSNVAAWVDASWADQLGNNVRSRKAWLLDSIMLGKGQINLCVRWGATTAPTAAVKNGMAGAVQKWFNDWFSKLADYGCFPYPTVTTKVTGWAVRPGNTAWVSDLDSSIRVYTETDAEGEPKCSDSCSFFNNWSHSFPKCAAGEESHFDYWLWLDDTIGGGAAAVGGDWGLRMPVRNFVNAMNQSNLVIEHEMGHGFGFQDYYEWTGPTPAGGSLMIVGSTNSQSPTTADTWLLRRTWKEMKTLRGW